MSATISTAATEAPTNVQATGHYGSWLSLATVSWTPGTSSDVTGHELTAYRWNGNATVAGITHGTSNSTSFFLANGTTYSLSVTTVTASGWTAQSTKTGTIRC